MSDYLNNNIKTETQGNFADILKENGFSIKPQNNSADGIEILEISSDKIIETVLFLKTNNSAQFDILMYLTGVDTGENFVVVYHLYSSVFKRNLILKVWIDRACPEISSLSSIYSTANWHERETFDLFGINFKYHPDLKRILLPEEWVGHPLRKDYVMNDSKLVWNER